jgi:hypothetical protein
MHVNPCISFVSVEGMNPATVLSDMVVFFLSPYRHVEILL